MPWGDDDPTLLKAKGAPQAAPVASSWGDADPAISARPSGQKQKSQKLGVLEGVLPVLDKFAPYSPANLIPGFRERNTAGLEGLHRRVGEMQETKRPGTLGKTAATMALTMPAVLATKDPLLLGGIQGGMSSEHHDPIGIAMDAGFGAIFNKGAGAAANAVADVLKPTIAPAVSMLSKAGVRLTPGQIKGGKALVREDKAMSRPIVGDRIAADRGQFVDDFNRGGVNKVLFHIGDRLPDHVATGHDAVGYMQGAISKAYEGVMPKLSLAPDARLAAGFRQAQQITDTLSPEQQQTFANILRPNVDFKAQGGVMSGRQLARSLRDLRDRAAGYSRSSLESERQLGSALGKVVDGLNSSLTSQNPEFAPVLKAANRAYRDSQVVNRAAAAADDGVATTGQFKTASRAADRTKAKRATAAGNGPMQDYTSAGRAVTGKTADSGTAGRILDGKWIPTARGALDAGLYEADKALTGLRLSPRSPVAQQLAGLLRQYKPTLSAIGGPVTGGLLAGLLGNE